MTQINLATEMLDATSEVNSDTLNQVLTTAPITDFANMLMNAMEYCDLDKLRKI